MSTMVVSQVALLRLLSEFVWTHAMTVATCGLQCCFMSFPRDALALLIFRPSCAAVAGFAQQRLTRRLIGIEALEHAGRKLTVSLSRRGWWQSID
ncbi:hypothetical protein [Xanthomonas sacchari]|uniref:hypothetical protein n=1 Tax=Xanthomonas sacchari TaxID=56458 RepID=UPI003529B4AD